MNKRILYGLIGLIFIVTLSTAIILWAQGYQINLQNGIVEKTGIISIQSNPSGATVYLNGNIKGTTPLSISNLVKGKYEIKVSKNNFSTWESQEYVNPGVITNVYPVLFNSTFTSNKVETPGTLISYITMPDNNSALMEINQNGSNSLWVRTYNNGIINTGISQQQVISLNNFPIFQNETIDLNKSLFNKDNNKVLLYGTNSNNEVNYFIVTLDSTSPPQQLSDLINFNLYKNISWGFDDNTILLTRPGEMLSLNINSQQKILLYQNNSTDLPLYTIVNSNYYFPSQSNSQNGLQVIDYDGIPKNFIPLSVTSNITSIISNGNDQLALSTDKGTYIYNLSTGNLILITDFQTNLYNFSPNGKNILFTDLQGKFNTYISDSNLTYPLNINKSNISNIIWHPFSTELIYIEKSQDSLSNLKAVDSTGQSDITLMKDISNLSPYLTIYGDKLEIDINNSIYLINSEQYNNSFIF